MKTTWKDFFASNKVQKAIWIILALVALLVAFQAGIFVGFEKARFSNRIGERYFMQVGSRRNVGLFPGEGFGGPHGSFGRIVEIKLPFVVIADRDGNDKTIMVSSSTNIRDADGDERVNILAANQTVVVFGDASSSDAIIDARLIRILPAPQQ